MKDLFFNSPLERYECPKNDVATKGIFFVLVGWTIIGFLYWLDNNETEGCEMIEKSIFSTGNTISSFTSIGLLISAYYLKQKQLLLLSIELMFWLYKLFCVKGGYAVGLTAVPIMTVVYFDIVALALRLILIKRVGQLPVTSLIIVMPILLFILLKLRLLLFLINRS